MHPQYYQIVKYRQDGHPVVQRAYGRVTLERAREICSDETTHRKKGDGKDWFLGFRAI